MLSCTALQAFGREAKGDTEAIRYTLGIRSHQGVASHWVESSPSSAQAYS
jgi:hypothetical protein